MVDRDVLRGLLLGPPGRAGRCKRRSCQAIRGAASRATEPNGRSGRPASACPRPRAHRAFAARGRATESGGFAQGRTAMQLGMIGLGRMGANMVERLMK